MEKQGVIITSRTAVVGIYVPDLVIIDDGLVKVVETNDEWILLHKSHLFVIEL